MSYDIRPYQPGDEAGILDLYRENYPTPRTLEQWTWEYKDTAAGPSVIYVICKNDEIIGHYAIIPLPAFCDGKKILLGKAEGAMIKPQERFIAARKGFLKELVKRGRLDAFAAGIPIIFGFTSQPRDFVKAGFQDIGKLYALQRDIHLTERAKVWLKNKLGKTSDLLKTSFVENIHSKMVLGREALKKRIVGSVEPTIPVDAAAITEQTDSKSVIDLERSQEYLIWRYERNPLARADILTARCEGRLLGWMAVSVSGNKKGTGYILDTCVGMEDRDAVLFSLFQQAMSYFKSKGVAHVICWRSDYAGDELMINNFIRWGQRREVHAINLVLQVNDQQVDPAFVMDTKNWSISMALTEGRVG